MCLGEIPWKKCTNRVILYLRSFFLLCELRCGKISFSVLSLKRSDFTWRRLANRTHSVFEERTFGTSQSSVMD